jgi:hypothetical protein
VAFWSQLAGCSRLAGTNPWSFIVLAGLIFLCWGEIFSLFPAMCTDLFGPKYATTNLSCLYTAKGRRRLPGAGGQFGGGAHA